MKTRTLLITIILLTLSMVVIAGGSKKTLSIDEAYDILAGTWLNEEYSGYRSYKFIVQPNGTYIGFPSMSSDDLTYTRRLTILDTMIDSDGKIWIKAQNKGESSLGRKFTVYELQKYSNSNMTLEVFDSEVEGWWGEGFPTDLEPVDHLRYRYRIYYRQ
jgi:hypothetical protein